MSRQALIWVIDDDPELRKLLDEYLARQDFAVRTTAVQNSLNLETSPLY
jgi:DNA-binding NtrC family response regulator